MKGLRYGLIPALLILVPYMALVTAPFALADRIRAKREQKEEIRV